MDQSAIGRELRARRAALGLTVAAVSAECGLSVPYIANLENGRGNPTVTALSRLAGALGAELVIGFLPEQAGEPSAGAGQAGISASLVRFSRSPAFRQAVRTMAGALGTGEDGLSARTVTALAALEHVTGRELSQPDWSRILDALLLVAAHPAQ